MIENLQLPTVAPNIIEKVNLRPLRTIHTPSLLSISPNHSPTKQTTDEDEFSGTMIATASNDHSPHPIRRGSSNVATDGPPPSLTVTKNVNGSAAVSEEHRVQASEYLASYIKVLRMHYTIADFSLPH